MWNWREAQRSLIPVGMLLVITSILLIGIFAFTIRQMPPDYLAFPLTAGIILVGLKVFFNK